MSNFFSLAVSDYLAISLVALATYLMRASFVARQSAWTLNRYLRIALDHIPGACLVALIVPMVWIVDDHFNWDTARSMALLGAAVAGYFWRSLYVPLIVGFGILWLVKYFQSL